MSAVSAGEGLCEMIELPEAEHPWFVACQFHPGIYFHPQEQGIHCSTAFIKAAASYANKPLPVEAALPGKVKNIA